MQDLKKVLCQNGADFRFDVCVRVYIFLRAIGSTDIVTPGFNPAHGSAKVLSAFGTAHIMRQK